MNAVLGQPGHVMMALRDAVSAGSADKHLDNLSVSMIPNQGARKSKDTLEKWDASFWGWALFLLPSLLSTDHFAG